MAAMVIAMPSVTHPRALGFVSGDHLRSWPAARSFMCGNPLLRLGNVRVGWRSWQGDVVRCGGEGVGRVDGEQQFVNRVFIFGIGYTAIVLANVLKRRGWEVAGTCRSEEKREALEVRGIRAHRFNPDNDGEGLQEEAIRELCGATHIVSSVPPVGDFDCDPVLGSLQGPLLQAAGGRLQWLGYLSSTSVYGDWQGEWVDEGIEPRPVERKAIARWEAEKRWMQFGEDAGVCVHVFRLGGIYGPGRSALDTVRRGEKLSSRQQLRGHKRFTSRVHVADICQVVMKAMASGELSRTRVYNVVDDDPSPRAEVMAYARGLLQIQGAVVVEEDGHAPANSGKELSETVRPVSSGQVSEKRVSNRRVKDELQIELLFPTYRFGLEAIASGSNNPFD